MMKAPLTITIYPDSELGRGLDESAGEPVELVRGGSRFRVTREVDDPWAHYGPAKLRSGLKKVPGLLFLKEGECIIETIDRGREEGPRPIDLTDDHLSTSAKCLA